MRKKSGVKSKRREEKERKIEIEKGRFRVEERKGR